LTHQKEKERKRKKAKINQTSLSFYLMSMDILCSSVKALPLALATA
jgi:hypothetical protein